MTVFRRAASRGVDRAEFKGELLAFLLGRWAARTSRPRTQRERLLNVRELLRLVGSVRPHEARACLTATRPAVFAGIGAAAGRTTRRAEASLRAIREE